jgi:hypothetical protein
MGENLLDWIDDDEDVKRAEMVMMLLDQNLNPNQEFNVMFSTLTPWQGALFYILNITSDTKVDLSDPSWPQISPKIEWRGSARIAWIAAINSFLDHGANPTASISFGQKTKANKSLGGWSALQVAREAFGIDANSKDLIDRLEALSKAVEHRLGPPANYPGMAFSRHYSTTNQTFNLVKSDFMCK